MTRCTVAEPDLVLAQTDPSGEWEAASTAALDVALTSEGGTALRVDVSGPAVARVMLRWHRAHPVTALVMGDAWERGYGELEWRSIRPERVLPWMALVHDPASGRTWGYGVQVRGGAFAFWQVDAQGLSLVLDLRSGGEPVRPGDRAVHAATVHWTVSDSTPFRAQQELTAVLCPDPLLPDEPVAGANNWYYAYGRGLSARGVAADARFVSDLAGESRVRPFQIVDDGWSAHGVGDGESASAGPWAQSRPQMGDMSELAAAITAEGARPGIWFRPLLRRGHGASGVRTAAADVCALDPSDPGVLDIVSADVECFVAWGFELIKQDFSSFDLLGAWGPQLGARPSRGPALHNPGLTTAEALTGLYSRIHEAAGDAIVIGCNVFGHLAAGLQQVCRIGDDVSGLDWNRTRRVGVNALAFRLAQNTRFFNVDADCVPSTPDTPWAMNRQFLDLVSRSGAAMFISTDPDTRNDGVENDLSEALRRVLGGQEGGLEPVDWLHSPTPSRWKCERGLNYTWLTSAGADAFEVPAGQEA